MRSRVIAIGSTTHRNRIGRVYSLWLTARAAGLEFSYVGIDDGALWEPLRVEEEFLASVRTGPDLTFVEDEVTRQIDSDTTLLVCKPRPELLHLGRQLARRTPVLVDIDDPELLDPWGGASLALRAKRVIRQGPRQHRFGWARRVVRSMPVITSNPLLQRLYGGEIVPHVREPASAPATRPETDAFVIGFVGTVREHKGIDSLREAAALVAQERPVRLRITAPPPVDARPWEDWLGPTTLAEGRRLVEDCHTVAIVSRAGAWGDYQLPVKLVDAMASGVPAVVTARPPILWAAGGTAVVVRDDSSTDLALAFGLLAEDARLASNLGAAAWRRARAAFTPEVAARGLITAIEQADATAARDRS